MDDVRARVKIGERVSVPACKLGWLVGKDRERAGGWQLWECSAWSRARPNG